MELGCNYSKVSPVLRFRTGSCVAIVQRILADRLLIPLGCFDGSCWQISPIRACGKIRPLLSPLCVLFLAFPGFFPPPPLFPCSQPPLRPPEADFRDLTQLPFSHQQELVNLLLTGRAVSNVFNDIVELDSGDGNITLLRGIEARSDIGFLSLFEHYNVCQVPMCTLGPQQPRFPRPLR